MSEELLNEVEAINAIYGDESLNAVGVDGIYVLHLPQHAVALRIRFPKDYPKAPPTILGSESSGERKGEATQIVDIFREVLDRVFQPGEVCLFDVVEEVISSLGDVHTLDDRSSNNAAQADDHDEKGISMQKQPQNADNTAALGPPNWTTSDVVVELKSVFIARSVHVSSPKQAAQSIQYLLDSDKKVRSATHNITAWRIRGENGVTFQDCDDDGETAAGGRVLHLMQLMDIWDAMVVVTRWYGGHQLGPKRFSIINTVAREAFVKGGFAHEDIPDKKRKGNR